MNKEKRQKKTKLLYAAILIVTFTGWLISSDFSIKRLPVLFTDTSVLPESFHFDEEISKNAKKIVAHEYSLLPSGIKDMIASDSTLSVRFSADSTLIGYNSSSEHIKNNTGIARGHYDAAANHITIVVPKGFAVKYYVGSEKKTSFLHETGHYYDIKCGELSLDDNFTSLLNAVVKEYTDNEYQFSSNKRTDENIYNKEVFAVMFEDYILDSNKLKRKCPEMYKYFKGLFSE